jgi:pumilio RNA-binding family
LSPPGRYGSVLSSSTTGSVNGGNGTTTSPADYFHPQNDVFDPNLFQPNHGAAAFPMQRSQSAAPSSSTLTTTSLMDHNKARFHFSTPPGTTSATSTSNYTSRMKQNIGPPPGLPLQQPNQDQSLLLDSLTTTFSSMSHLPIQRPASAGVIGTTESLLSGGRNHNHHGGAVRPAPKTLMELIQEEHIPITPSQYQSQQQQQPYRSDMEDGATTTTAATDHTQNTNYHNDNRNETNRSDSLDSTPKHAMSQPGHASSSLPLSSSSSLQRQFLQDQQQLQEQNQYQNNKNLDDSNMGENPNHEMPSSYKNRNNEPYVHSNHQYVVVSGNEQQHQRSPYSSLNHSGRNGSSSMPQPQQQYQSNSGYYRPSNEFSDEADIMMQAPMYTPQQQQIYYNGGKPQQQQQHGAGNINHQQQLQPGMLHTNNNGSSRMQNQVNLSINASQQQSQTIYMNTPGQVQHQLSEQVSYGYATTNAQQYPSSYQNHSQRQQVLHHPTPTHMPSTNHQQDQYVSVVPIQRSSNGTSVSYWQPNGMIQQQSQQSHHHHPQHQQVIFPTSGLVTMGGQISHTMDTSTMYHAVVSAANHNGKSRDKVTSRGTRRVAGSGRGNGLVGNHHRDTKCDIPTTSAVLEEFRSGKSRDWTMRRIEGYIVEFCQDQSGSRFIQQRLEMGDHNEQQIVMKEVLRAIRRLRNDVFGNYVVQKLLDFGTANMKGEIRNTLEGEMLSLSLQMYGCRVVQKAIETVDEEDLPRMLREFHNDVLGCIHDQNGNHVIQKCIEVVNSRANKAEASGDVHRATFLREQIDFILDDVLTNATGLSCHPYGCRVLQRILEHTTEEKKVAILDEIQRRHKDLMDDQYGNYVIQHVLQYGRDVDRDSIVQIVVDCGLLGLARQKFASNVVEKLLKYGNSSQRRAVVREMLKVRFVPFSFPNLQFEIAHSERIFYFISDVRRKRMIQRYHLNLVMVVPLLCY